MKSGELSVNEYQVAQTGVLAEKYVLEPEVEEYNRIIESWNGLEGSQGSCHRQG